MVILSSYIFSLANGKITKVTDQYCLVKLTDEGSTQLRKLVEEICKVCKYALHIYIYWQSQQVGIFKLGASVLS